mmetsp:Transcript_32739/g.48505  ORF Transcript_32739/g.48505 Transcript_32739/m.48505 type:complete len:225 (+) Transcript_32739:1906-2580(+)
MYHRSLFSNRQPSSDGKCDTHHFAYQRFDPNNAGQIDSIEKALDFRNTRSSRHWFPPNKEGRNQRKDGLIKEKCQKGRASKRNTRLLCLAVAAIKHILTSATIRGCIVVLLQQIIILHFRFCGLSDICVFQQLIHLVKFVRTQCFGTNITDRRYKSLNDSNKKGRNPSFQCTLFARRPPLSPISEMQLCYIGSPNFTFIRFIIVRLNVCSIVFRSLEAMIKTIA